MSKVQPRSRFRPFFPMADVIPAAGGPTGTRVEHFVVTADEAKFYSGMEALRPGGRLNAIDAGHYARLYSGNTLVMSDTPFEMLTNAAAVEYAKGDVLIGGLGLGLVVLPICRKPGVRSVTVIERDPDVVRLVEDPLRRHLSGNQSAGLLIWTDDVHTWKPSPLNVHKFDYAYLDIWPNVCVDDYEEHKTLRRRWRRWMRKGGKVESWMFEHLQELVRAGRWR